MMFEKKLKFYVVKTQDGNLACCIKTGNPLIGDNKENLKNLLRIMKKQEPKYEKCKIVKVKECFF